MTRAEPSVARRIVAFHLDDEGQWVAELSCLHTQHVRHRPPFENRPWVLDDATRGARIGTRLECPLCARGELPAGLHRARTAGPFDEQNAPRALFASHEIAASRWGVLHVLEGRAELVFTDERRFVVEAGEERAIPPTMLHHLEVLAHVRFEIDFLVPGVVDADAPDLDA